MNTPEKKPKAIFVQYDNDELINIRDLPKNDYEDFLDSMDKLRILYITITARQNRKR